MLLTLLGELSGAEYGAGEGDGIFAASTAGSNPLVITNSDGVTWTFIPGIPQYIQPELRAKVAALLTAKGVVPKGDNI